MTTYLITRHPAAEKWVKKRLSDEVLVVPHADEEFWAGLTNKDSVVGTLPIHLAAKAVLITRHAFGFITMSVPPELRGKELTVEQMESVCSAELSWFMVEEV